MSISEKIIARVNKIDADDDFKDLLISILAEEDKGNFRFKDSFERMVNDYLGRKEEKNSD